LKRKREKRERERERGRVDEQRSEAGCDVLEGWVGC